MKMVFEWLELCAVLLTTFAVIVGGGMGFFVLLGNVLQ